MHQGNLDVLSFGGLNLGVLAQMVSDDGADGVRLFLCEGQNELLGFRELMGGFCAVGALDRVVRSLESRRVGWLVGRSLPLAGGG